VLSFDVLYDLSVMSAHFALINDILSMIWNSGITDDWIFEGFSKKVYQNKGSLTLNLDERKKNLPEVNFRKYSVLHETRNEGRKAREKIIIQATEAREKIYIKATETETYHPRAKRLKEEFRM